MASPAESGPGAGGEPPFRPDLVLIPPGQEYVAFDPYELFAWTVTGNTKLNRRWPPHEFDLSPQNIVSGAGLMDATRSSRLVHVSNAIQEVFPEAMHKPARISETDPPVIEWQGAQKSLRVTEKFLQGEVKVGSTKIPRQVLIPPAYLVDLILIDREWATRRHPVLGAIFQVERDYGSQLTAADMDQFRLDLVLSTQQTLVVQIYNDFIRRFRAIAAPAK